jgi:hypothetical protein
MLYRHFSSCSITRGSQHTLRECFLADGVDFCLTRFVTFRTVVAHFRAGVADLLEPAVEAARGKLEPCRVLRGSYIDR